MFPIANLSSEALFTLGIAVITLVLLLRIYRKRKKSASNETGRNQFERVRREVDGSAKYTLWEVEIEERLREVEARLDNKIAALEYLLSEAEDVLQQLQKTAEERET